MSRKNLVDGSVAYKERKFQIAEELFRKATQRDPNGTTDEGRTAQVFLARTLHSKYVGNRQDKAVAEDAIVQYQKALGFDPNDQSSYKAIAGLYVNLEQQDKWLNWVTERSNNANILQQYRAEALTSLAAKDNTCANELTDTEKSKKTVKKDGKDAFQFIKPENPGDFDKLKGCVAHGTELIDKAVAFETDEVKNAKTVDVKGLTDQQLKEKSELTKVFESVRSYRYSLTNQASRVAEMEGNTAEYSRLKDLTDQYKAQFSELSEVNKNIQAEIDARIAAKQEAANANANANAQK